MKYLYDGHSGKFSYTLSDAGVLTVAGKGRLTNDVFSELYNAGLSQNVREVEILDGITGIGPGTFSPGLDEKTSKYKSFANLEKVTLADTVSTIMPRAFSCCEKLHHLHLSSGLRIIGAEAFLLCSSLKKVDFPASLSAIGDFAFYKCEQLQKVNFPEGLMHIGAEAFGECPKLRGVWLPFSLDNLSSRERIAKSAFPDGCFGYDLSEKVDSKSRFVKRLNSLEEGIAAIERYSMKNPSRRYQLQKNFSAALLRQRDNGEYFIPVPSACHEEESQSDLKKVMESVFSDNSLSLGHWDFRMVFAGDVLSDGSGEKYSNLTHPAFEVWNYSRPGQNPLYMGLFSYNDVWMYCSEIIPLSDTFIMWKGRVEDLHSNNGRKSITAMIKEAEKKANHTLQAIDPRIPEHAI